MNVYFAPLEGVTDVVYRRVHHACFTGVQKYFIPFISPTQHLTFNSREQRQISPAENAGVPAVPQILTKNAEHFLWMAQMLQDAGFNEINLNLGCPSGTVTAKGKGSGMLRDRDALQRFLDEIFAHSPIPISIKTRVGYDSPDEWPALLALFARYPVHELIVHPRTRAAFYGGQPHRSLCQSVLSDTDLPFVYNGDLFTAADCLGFLNAFPGTKALMLGRGLVANPALAQSLNGGAPLTLSALRDFHDRLYAAYLECWPQKAVVGHMHEIMKYVLCCFEDPQKPRRALRKATSLEAYSDAVDVLFGTHRLTDNPGFITGTKV